MNVNNPYIFVFTIVLFVVSTTVALIESKMILLSIGNFIKKCLRSV